MITPPTRKAEMRKAIRYLDENGGWDHACPRMDAAQIYGGLHYCEDTGWIERSSAYGVECWRLTDEGIALRKAIGDVGTVAPNQTPHPA